MKTYQEVIKMLARIQHTYKRAGWGKTVQDETELVGWIYEKKLVDVDADIYMLVEDLTAKQVQVDIADAMLRRDDEKRILT